MVQFVFQSLSGSIFQGSNGPATQLMYRLEDVKRRTLAVVNRTQNGCTCSTVDLDCVRNLSLTSLLNCQSTTFSRQGYNAVLAPISLYPVADNITIPDYPAKLLYASFALKGRSVLTGATVDEGSNLFSFFGVPKDFPTDFAQRPLMRLFNGTVDLDTLFADPMYQTGGATPFNILSNISSTSFL
jgi:hypothetical protein